LKFIKVH